MNNDDDERPNVTFDIARDGRLISIAIACNNLEHAAGVYQAMVLASERGAMRLTMIAGKEGMVMVERGPK